MPLTAAEEQRLQDLENSLTPQEESRLRELEQSVAPQTGTEAAPIQLDAQGQPTGPLPADLTSPRPYTTPGYQGLDVFHPGGTISRPPADTSQVGTGIAGGFLRTGGPLGGNAPTAQGAQSFKESLLPAAGSAVGTGLGYAVAGAPGAKVGDLLGTAGGYAANVGLGVEPYDPLKAALTIGPSALSTTVSGLVGAGSALARSSRAGKTAILGERVAQTDALNTRVDQYNKGALAAQGQREAAVGRANEGIARYNQQAQAAQGYADATTAAFNAQAKADFEASRALQDQFKSQTAAQVQSDLEAYQALLDTQRANKQQYRDQLRLLTRAQRQQNVGKVGTFLERLPGIPSAQQVDDAYAEASMLAQSYGKPIVFDQVQQIRRDILKEAESVRKAPGGARLARTLKEVAGVGADDTMTLSDVQTSLKVLKEHQRGLVESKTEFARTKARAYGRFITAMEDGLEELASDEAQPEAFRSVLKLANSYYLKRETSEQLTKFLTNDLVKNAPNGVEVLDPAGALTALRRPQNARLRAFMERTTFPEMQGKNLYELTTETLTQMASQDDAASEALRALVRTGGVTLPSKPAMPPTSATAIPNRPLQMMPPTPGQPLAPIPVPQNTTQLLNKAPTPTADLSPGLLAVSANATGRLGMAITAGLAYGRGNYPALAAAAGAATIAPHYISQLMLTPTGQRFLLTLTKTQGTRLTPTMTGFLAAGARAMLGSVGGTDRAPALPGVAPIP